MPMQVIKSNKKTLFLQEYVKNKGNISKACEKTGIARKTFYEWLKQPAFKEGFDEAVETFNDAIEAKILNIAEEGDKEMLRFWAKTKMKQRGFVEKQELEQTGNVKLEIIERLEKCFKPKSQ